MKRFAKLFVALSLFALSIISPFMSTAATTATAATNATIGTGYTCAEDVVYKTQYVSVSSIKGDIIVNWGARDEDCVFLSTYAQSYYSGANTYATWSTQKSPSTTSQSSANTTTLYTNLQTFLNSKHKIYTIYQGSPNPKTLLQYTDCVRNDTSKVSLIYSGAMVTGSWDGSTYNQEHTWPKSHLSTSKAIGDLIQLRACNVNENSSRGNTAYGETGGRYNPLYTKKITNEGVDARGDVARIVLYIYVHYGQNNIFTDAIENLTVLLKWMKEDPVDTWEMARNDSVQSMTGVRNVFVDYPELAWLMFGKDVPSDMSTPSKNSQGGSSSNSSSSSSSSNSSSSSSSSSSNSSSSSASSSSSSSSSSVNNSSSSSNSSSTVPNPSNTLEILQAAYALKHGEYLPGTFTLTGVVSQIMKVENGNTCLYMVINGHTEYKLYCRWLQDVDNLKVGDVITVTGRIRRYDNYVEFYEPVLGTGSSSDSSSNSSVSSDSSNSASNSSSGTATQMPINCQSAIGVPFGALFIAFIGVSIMRKREN